MVRTQHVLNRRGCLNLMTVVLSVYSVSWWSLPNHALLLVAPTSDPYKRRSLDKILPKSQTSHRRLPLIGIMALCLRMQWTPVLLHIITSSCCCRLDFSFSSPLFNYLLFLFFINGIKQALFFNKSLETTTTTTHSNCICDKSDYYDDDVKRWFAIILLYNILRVPLCI